MKKGKSNRVGHIGLGNKKTPNIQYSEFFFYLVFSLEVISKSVLKGVFLVEKGECRRK